MKAAVAPPTSLRDAIGNDRDFSRVFADQLALLYVLWDLVHVALGEDDVL